MGIPIGNLTSQIFANIYLNELDRFIKHNLKVRYYLRYGDDFIVLCRNRHELEIIRNKTIDFINNELKLEINGKNDIIVKAKWGVKFLGAVIYPSGRSLNSRNRHRLWKRLNISNASSYHGLIRQFQSKQLAEYNWKMIDIIFDTI